MIATVETQIIALRNSTTAMLRELGICSHRLGYKYLSVAVPCYRLDDSQSLTKEIYPYVAHCFGCSDWYSVERSVRTSILAAWDLRDPTIWQQYFPGLKKPPSNKHFIAVLAEQLE